MLSVKVSKIEFSTRGAHHGVELDFIYLIKKIFLLLLLFVSFGHGPRDVDSSSLTGIEPAPPLLATHSLNHWTTKEVPWNLILSLQMHLRETLAL